MGKSRTRWPVRTYSQGVPGASGRVLVVDDNKVIRQLIRVNLELEGFEVVTACDGAECLEVVHEVRPDAVTLDVVMPRLDGLRTAAQLRADPRTRDLPLAIVSACTPDEVDAGLDAGVDVFLPKPFEPAALVDVVRKLVRQGQGREYDDSGAPPVPSGPSGPSGPSAPGAPGAPAELTGPRPPTDPGEPDDYGTPGNGTAPGTPSPPGTPSTPSLPGTPSTPPPPGTPSTPATPPTPNTPQTPLTAPPTPDDPSEPATPHHGDEKRPAQSGS